MEFLSSDLEQIAISLRVSKMGDKLPPQMVEYANNILVGSGLVAQSVLPLSKLSREEFERVIDEIQTKLLGA